MDRRAAAAPSVEHSLVHTCTQRAVEGVVHHICGVLTPAPWVLRRWWDMFIIFTVFGITGSSTMFFVRPFITKFLKLEGIANS